MANGNDGSDFIKGLLFGGLFGAVIALLYAPKSGKEMRDEIKQRSLELMDDAESGLEVAQKRAEAILADATKQIDELRKEAEKAVGDLKEEALEKYEKSKKTLAKEKGRVKDALEAGLAAFKEEKQSKNKKS
jgi:gas vesicle protein